MAIKIDRALDKDDIREGFATIKGSRLKGRIVYTLPGGEKTLDKEKAKKYSKRIDTLIRINLKRSGKSLI